MLVSGSTGEPLDVYTIGVTHFSISEWENPDWEPYPPEWICPRWYPLARHLEIIRLAYGRPMVITPNGGYRSAAHNRHVDGSKRSQHMLGRAADIKAPGRQAKRLWRIIWNLRREGRLPELSGVGRYKWGCHLDVGGPLMPDGSPRRWVSQTSRPAVSAVPASSLSA